MTRLLATSSFVTSPTTTEPHHTNTSLRSTPSTLCLYPSLSRSIERCSSPLHHRSLTSSSTGSSGTKPRRVEFSFDSPTTAGEETCSLASSRRSLRSSTRRNSDVPSPTPSAPAPQEKPHHGILKRVASSASCCDSLCSLNSTTTATTTTTTTLDVISLDRILVLARVWFTSPHLVAQANAMNQEEDSSIVLKLRISRSGTPFSTVVRLLTAQVRGRLRDERVEVCGVRVQTRKWGKAGGEWSAVEEEVGWRLRVGEVCGEEVMHVLVSV
ncbi:hypothetical protein HDU98_000119 [Podochytrium sp. JEL0797]|nr:hypothetical protein HDU98_000119 [Podochytrium sp. JEL0797]